MNLPITPPTDNLYKFLAVAGVALVIAAFALPLQEATALNREVAALKGDIAALDPRPGAPAAADADAAWLPPDLRAKTVRLRLT